MIRDSELSAVVWQERGRESYQKEFIEVWGEWRTSEFVQIGVFEKKILQSSKGKMC